MLEKNLTALEKANPGLANRIRETPISPDITFFRGPNQDINIAYKDIALHRMADPMGEALEVFNKEVPEASRDDGSVIIMFGLGMGYLLRRTFVSSKAQIILFEPHMAVLRATLEGVDLSEELGSKRFTLITDIDQIAPAMASNYLIGDAMSIISLPAYQAQEPEMLLKILDEIEASMFVNIVSQNTTILMVEEFTRKSLENLPEFLQYPEIAIMHDQFTGVPGVVVSAGPSLDRPGVLEALKANQDNCVISCVGQAAKALDKAGITPHFVNVLEIKDVSQQVSGVSFMKDTNLILLPQTNTKLYHIPTKRKLISHTNKDPLTFWLSGSMERVLYGYSHQGTVSITALIHLMKMGCNPIFLLGQDLSFPEGKIYAQNSVYRGCHFTIDEQGKKHVHLENVEEFYGAEGFFKDEEGWKKETSKFESMLAETKGWNGEKLFTNINYGAYKKAFERIQEGNPQFQLVNCSEGGAYMEGYEHLPFIEALEKYNVENYHVAERLENAFKESYHVEEPGSELYQKVHRRYLDDKKSLKAIRRIVSSGLKIVKKGLKELKSTDEITESLQEHIAALSELDVELLSHTQQNVLINCYIKRDLFRFSKTYGRKISHNDDEAQEGDLAELKENLESTILLYEAVKKGVDGIMETLDPIFERFPKPKRISKAKPMRTKSQTEALCKVGA